MIDTYRNHLSSNTARNPLLLLPTHIPDRQIAGQILEHEPRLPLIESNGILVFVRNQLSQMGAVNAANFLQQKPTLLSTLGADSLNGLGNLDIAEQVCRESGGCLRG